MTAHHLYTGAEAQSLLDDYTATPRITFGDECLGGVPLCVDGRELLYKASADDDDDGDWIYVDRWEAAMHDASPDLAASVVSLAADLHRVTMERDGARLSLDAAQSARIKQSLELADARAEVVRLRAQLDAVASSVPTDAALVDSQSWSILVSGRSFVRASVFRGLTCWHAKHDDSLMGAMGETPREAVEHLAVVLGIDGAVALPIVDATAGGAT